MVLAVGLELHKQPDHHGVLLLQHNINKIKHKMCHTIPENMQLSARGHDQSDTRALLLGRRRPGLAGGEAGPSLPRGVAMGTEAGAGHVPRRVGAVHARLLTMHHDELRRARAHAAAVARKLIAVAAVLWRLQPGQPSMEEIGTAT